jgi:PAS domain S-box-containing protein
MATALDTLLDELEPEILDRWQERIVRSGLLGPGVAPEDLRARLRGLLSDLREALDRCGAKPGSVPISLRLKPHTPAPAPRESVRPETLLSLVIGRDVVHEVLAERLPPEQAAACADTLVSAFQRLFSMHGPGACARCMADQDESRMRVEQRLATVVEHSRDAILSCDAAQGIVGWNLGAEALFGYSAEEMKGQGLDRLLPRERLASGWLAETTRRVRATGHVRQGELELVARDGTRVWVDASINRMRGPDGDDLGLWAVFRDITEQRRLLQQSLDAERLALIGTMSAKFAHEIRNPLASILLNIELIRDALAQRPPASTGTAADDEELVSSIANEVGRIRNVVQEYLRFGRLPNIRRSAIDLDEVIRRGLTVLAPELKSRGVTLELDLAGAGARVVADGDQAWQAILNLIGNAMEAMPQGGRIAISTRAVEDGMRCVVADSGPGIPVEIQERIFLPFFSTKRSGTGLGLPFARQVLAEHGSALEFETSPTGTRFWFDLPRAPADAR